VSVVVKCICNATWKTCKIEISIINSNYVFFYILYINVFYPYDLLRSKQVAAFKYFSSLQRVAVNRRSQYFEISYHREFLFTDLWERSEGGVISGFNCIHKDKTYTDFKSKWPALLEVVW
jgi:hypothetical protein